MPETRLILTWKGGPYELNTKRATNEAGEVVEYLVADSLQTYIKGLYRAAGLPQSSSHSLWQYAKVWRMWCAPVHTTRRRCRNNLRVAYEPLIAVGIKRLKQQSQFGGSKNANAGICVRP